MKFRSLFFSFFLVAQAIGQDSSFTMKQAVDLALQQNLDIQIAGSELEIAKVNNNWGNAGALPTVNLNIPIQRPYQILIKSYPMEIVL